AAARRAAAADPRSRAHADPTRGDTSKFDLSVAIVDSADGWHATFEYRTDLFERATIDRLLRHYAALLCEAVRTPDRAVLTLPFLDAGERAAEIAAARGADVREPFIAVHRAIETQALHTPHAVAVVADTESLTYESLNRRANRLAHRLIAEQVGVDVP